ncbi:hypothetical protein [uncultured Photobacterium sp.]|uniref:alpha/beta fold hydrolase n=1 Tax=uncultured Photobacterium sp. TaxID=173973 RepID=UPI002604AD85|nr:hypothetical protein [uncultured Photobacterium sp.]
MPVLIARGDEDELFSLSEAVEILQRIDGSKFMNIPFVDHAAHQESTEMFCLAISDFMK